MVVFHVCSDRSEFLFKASVSTCNDSLIRSLCHVQNLRLRLAALVDALGGYSVAKPLQEQGLETEGAIDKQLLDVLARVSADAKMVLDSKTQLARRVCIDESELLEKLQNIRKAVSVTFPMGLPSGDPVKRLLDAETAEEALAGTLIVLDVMSENTTELWWAGKQFLRDRYVRDLTGDNEKSTLIVHLQKHGRGAPSRKHDVNADEHKAMMAVYGKKQQELHQSVQDNTGDYTISSWADPKALKNSLRGTDNIRPF